MLSLLLVLQGLIPSPSRTSDVLNQHNPRITPIVKVVQDNQNAVVFIQTSWQKDVGRDWFGRMLSQKGGGEGSGVVIRKEGFIITNYHVIQDVAEKGSGKIQVNFNPEFDKQTYEADVVSYVMQEDLALIKIRRDRDCPTIVLGRSDDLMLGEPVIAIGNPVGETYSVNEGIISGLHRNKQIRSGTSVLDLPDLIQASASINFGNSGGPLLNINGELIGINCAIKLDAQNIGFAIPVDRVRSVLENQLLSPETAPAWLGFEVDLSDDHLRVAKVVPGSPAAKAGVQLGDCVVSVAGESVGNQDAYRLARVSLFPGRPVDLQVERKGRTERVRFEPWERVDGILYERLGLRAEDLDGVPAPRVTMVAERGPAKELDIQVGDLIEGVRPVQTLNGVRTFTRERLADVLAQIPAGTSLEIDVRRDLDGNLRYDRDETMRGTLKVQ